MGSWLVGNINGLKPLLFTVIVNYRKHGAAASPCAARRSTRPPGRARRRGRRRRWRACSECPLLWCAETDGASHQPAAETTSFKLRHTSAAARARLLRSQPVMPNGKEKKLHLILNEINLWWFIHFWRLPQRLKIHLPGSNTVNCNCIQSCMMI